MCQNPKLEIYYYIQRYATEYISTLRAIKQESIMITHLMHCAAVESEFNAMELILLQGEGVTPLYDMCIFAS